MTIRRTSGEDTELLVSLRMAFLTVAEKPPRQGNVSCRFGTVYNVYTFPKFRRKGYAELVMQEILRLAEERNLGSVDLLASEEGKPLYEKLGFRLPNHTFMRRNV